jgi:colanic acid biosynthesis glycosyl transferase WcaI
MNITVLCPHFRPDVAPTGEVITAIVEELAHLGHRLHVVTSLPWYRDHALEPGWDGQLVRHEDTAWGTITRVHPFPTDKSNLAARALAFGGFTVEATVLATIGRFRPDVVLAMSPPLTMGLAGWLAARRFGVPFVFNIQDVFPDVAVELGLLRGQKVIAAASKLERFTYDRADVVTVLSDELADNVRAKVARGRTGTAADVARAKVRVIPNFVDTESIAPGPTDNAYRAEFGLIGKQVVMYAGNVGFSQSLDLVLKAAAAMVDDERVRFVINGGGAARDELRHQAGSLGNVIFVDMQPKARLGEVLAAADVHVVPLRRGLAKASVPSKLYSILAAGRPVVASVDEGTEVARTVVAADAGVAVAPEDPDAFTAAIRALLDDPARARTCGASARRFVESWVSPAAVGATYGALFDELRH